MGHLVRCLALADELDMSHGCKVSFAINPSSTGPDLVQREGYSVHICPPANEGLAGDRWLKNILQGVDPEVVVLDVRNGPAAHCRRRTRTWRSSCSTMEVRIRP